MMNGNLSTAVEAIEYIPKEIRPVLFMVLTAIIYEIIV
jgi:hypothetical protein